MDDGLILPQYGHDEPDADRAFRCPAEDDDLLPHEGVMAPTTWNKD